MKPSQHPQQGRTLFVVVNTFDTAGAQIGTRTVDMYHYGTRKWLANHQWWAAHNGHTITTLTCAVEVAQAA